MQLQTVLDYPLRIHHVSRYVLQILLQFFLLSVLALHPDATPHCVQCAPTLAEALSSYFPLV